MTNQITKSMYLSGKLWILAIAAVFACVLLKPVSVSAKVSQKNQDAGTFDHYLALYYRENEKKQAKNNVQNNTLLVKIQNSAKESEKSEKPTIKSLEKFVIFNNHKPEEKKVAQWVDDGPKPDRVINAVITAYTSTPGQTDDTPFIAASGKHVYDGMIAANGLPFGTQIKIPSLYGDKIFTVDDRMNRRYGFGRMDIWLDTTVTEARKFGVKRVEVEIYYPQKEVVQVALEK